MRNIDELRKVLKAIEDIRTTFSRDLDMEEELDTVCMANASLVSENAMLKKLLDVQKAEANELRVRLEAVLYRLDVIRDAVDGNI